LELDQVEESRVEDRGDKESQKNNGRNRGESHVLIIVSITDQSLNFSKDFAQRSGTSQTVDVDGLPDFIGHYFQLFAVLVDGFCLRIRGKGELELGGVNLELKFAMLDSKKDLLTIRM
jgi:hypothetical protein